jgi:peptidyl-prolyl cis-trans isomerase C
MVPTGATSVGPATWTIEAALIFAIYEVLNPAAHQADRAYQVVLTKDDLRQLAVHWLAQGRPLPNGY